MDDTSRPRGALAVLAASATAAMFFASIGVNHIWPLAWLRAVDGGYALARAATQGRLTITDARGIIIAERVSSEAPEVLLVADVPVAPGGTFYSATGDWLPWACVMIVVLCGVAATARPRGVVRG